MSETLYEAKNPLNTDLTVMVRGINYTIPANGEITNVPEFVAKHWESLHEFLKFKKIAKVTTITEVQETKIEEVIEELKTLEDTTISLPEVLPEEITEAPKQETVKPVTKKANK